MAANTNAPLILAILGFYVFIGVLIGLYGLSNVESHPVSAPGENPSATNFLEQIALFFSSIFYTIVSFPAWANTLLFTPLALTLFYVFISFLRGSS